MERGDRRRLHKVEEGIHQGRNTSIPDFRIGDPFILTTDWSKVKIGGVFSQVQDGQERFLGCWGRKCYKYERNYPCYKVEVLAVFRVSRNGNVY